MCVSYQKLNQATRPFTSPIPCFDEAVQYINTEAKYFISMYMDCGYWQVVSAEEAREILPLFTLDGNKRWKVIPTGALNAAPTFVEMMMKLKTIGTHYLKNVVCKMLHQKLLLMMCYCMGTQPISS